MSLEDSRRSLWGFPLDISRKLGSPRHCYATPAVIRHSQVGAPAKVQPSRSGARQGSIAQVDPPPSGSPSQGPGSKAHGHSHLICDSEAIACKGRAFARNARRMCGFGCANLRRLDRAQRAFPGFLFHPRALQAAEAGRDLRNCAGRAARAPGRPVDRYRSNRFTDHVFMPPM